MSLSTAVCTAVIANGQMSLRYMFIRLKYCFILKYSIVDNFCARDSLML